MTRGALAAMAAGGLAAMGLSTAAPALAAPIPGSVPCSVPALAYSIAHAHNGQELLLARDCTYLLHSALPQVTNAVTLDGQNSTLQRSRYAPDFSLLTVGTGGDLTVADLNVRNGSGVKGGAIFNGAGLSLNGASFIGNSASSYGRAVENGDTGTIQNSTFNGNSTEYGAAVYTDEDLTIANSAFGGNTASEYGGGLANYGTTTVDHTSFRGNSAYREGGGVVNDVPRSEQTQRR